jgi:SAM-dependent methyltransferase
VSDFRAALYRRYVSTFKGDESRRDAHALEAYWSWCRHKYRPLLEGLSREGRVVELGCGPGHMLEFLQREGFRRVEGIDVSAEQVALARERGLNAHVADVFEYLAREHGRLDAVLALDFIEHFDRNEVTRLAALLHEALTEGGRLILQTPNGSGLFPGQVISGDLTHMTIFSPGSMRQLLQAAGFGDFRFLESGPVAKDLRGRIRLLLWRAIKRVANTVRQIESGKSQEIWTENLICCCRKIAS